MVASHFNGTGVANGFMPRDVYIRFMLGFTTLLPLALALALAFLPARSLGKPGARLNIPHRNYWLAPERRDETLRFLRRQMTRMASLMLLFLCYAHWLVLDANRTQPPVLPGDRVLPGLAAFFAAIALWAIAFVGHFRRVPR